MLLSSLERAWTSQTRRLVVSCQSRTISGGPRKCRRSHSCAFAADGFTLHCAGAWMPPWQPILFAPRLRIVKRPSRIHLVILSAAKDLHLPSVPTTNARVPHPASKGGNEQIHRPPCHP